MYPLIPSNITSVFSLSDVPNLKELVIRELFLCQMAQRSAIGIVIQRVGRSFLQ